MAAQPTAQSDFKDATRNRKVFTNVHEKFGLPSKVALLGLALSGFVFFIGTWWLGVLAGLVYFPAMYSIHKDDSKAMDVWLAAFSSSRLGYQAGLTRGRELVLLSEHDE